MGRTIIEDTRQQLSHGDKHGAKHIGFERAGVEVLRSKLPFGDYAWPPACAVDTKRSIAELYANVVAEHARFVRECEAARDAGCVLAILVENRHGIESLADLALWEEPEADFRKRKAARAPISGARLAKACQTMHERYGVLFGFCAPESAADKIIRILDHYGRGGADDGIRRSL